jgi:hypothetical protein
LLRAPEVAFSCGKSHFRALPLGIATQILPYSVFDSALYRKRIAKWLFPQEKATFDALPMCTYESKAL